MFYNYVLKIKCLLNCKIRYVLLLWHFRVSVFTFFCVSLEKYNWILKWNKFLIKTIKWFEATSKLCIGTFCIIMIRSFVRETHRIKKEVASPMLNQFYFQFCVTVINNGCSSFRLPLKKKRHGIVKNIRLT